MARKPGDVEALPAELAQDRHIDLDGRGPAPWGRRAVLCAFAALALAGLANVFGQEPSSSSATTAAATLRVEAPTTVRGGLFYQGRFEVFAHRSVKSLQLILRRGWIEQSQINTIEPAATDETSRGDRLILNYGALPAGRKLTVWMQFEANPLGAGRRDQGVEIRDGGRPLARIRRRVTTFP